MSLTVFSSGKVERAPAVVQVVSPVAPPRPSPHGRSHHRRRLLVEERRAGGCYPIRDPRVRRRCTLTTRMRLHQRPAPPLSPTPSPTPRC
jgi:hypothetical protein